MVRLLAVLGVLALATPAHAAKHPRFEPTDLELERPGTLELDTQFGVVRGQDPYRLVMPDFEIDLGIFANVELDLDGAYAIEGNPPDGPTLLDHQAPDNLWASVKVGLVDWRDAATQRAWAIGVQVGPKLPLAADNHGVGVEGLALLGHAAGPVHLVLDLGALADPHVGTAARPVGVEGGIDAELEIVQNAWSLLGELGGIHYVSADSDQLAATAGLQYSPIPRLDLSLVAMVGLAPGSDTFGVLFGVSPKLAVW
jgi:hypothetical protein